MCALVKAGGAAVGVYQSVGCVAGVRVPTRRVVAISGVLYEGLVRGQPPPRRAIVVAAHQLAVHAPPGRRFRVEGSHGEVQPGAPLR